MQELSIFLGIIKAYMYKKVIAVKYILCSSLGKVTWNSYIGVHRSFAFSHVTEVKRILNAKLMLYFLLRTTFDTQQGLNI